MKQAEWVEGMPADDARQIDRFCTRFEQACQGAGSAESLPRIEDFLPAAPERLRTALLQELTTLEVEYHRRRGEQVRLEDYTEYSPASTPAGTTTVRRFRPTPGSVPRTQCLRLRLVCAGLPDLPASDRAGRLPRHRGCLPGSATRSVSPHRSRRRCSTATARWAVSSYLAVSAPAQVGEVWRARDPKLERIVALKIPHAGLLSVPGNLERFLREARTAAQLRHPGIVTVHEVGVDSLGQRLGICRGRVAGRAGQATAARPAQVGGMVAEVAEALNSALPWAWSTGTSSRPTFSWGWLGNEGPGARGQGRWRSGV